MLTGVDDVGTGRGLKGDVVDGIDGIGVDGLEGRDEEFWVGWIVAGGVALACADEDGEFFDVGDYSGFGHGDLI